jgi:thiol-disulfide isomerase/thioredoxin
MDPSKTTRPELRKAKGERRKVLINPPSAIRHPPLKHWAYVAIFLVAVAISPSVPATSSTTAVQEPARVVLAEQFTATWCPYCPGSTGALERLEAEVGKENFVVLAYHERRSRFGNPDSQARVVWYDIDGFPTVIFNGIYPFVGGSTNPNQPEIDQGYRARYELSRRRPAPVEIALTGMLMMEDPSRYVAHCEAVITAISQITTQPKVRFALVENGIEYRAPNGETHFNWVVRDMLDEASLTITEPGQQETLTRSVEVQPGWNSQHLGIVVFVQVDERRREVLQAAMVEL